MGTILDRLADELLNLDPTDLEELLPIVQARMESPDTTDDWRRSVVAFFMINGIRATQSLAPHARRPVIPEGVPQLRLVK